MAAARFALDVDPALPLLLPLPRSTVPWRLQSRAIAVEFVQANFSCNIPRETRNRNAILSGYALCGTDAISRAAMNRRIEMRYHNAAVMLPLLVAMAAGCTTMGTGTGSTPSGANAATFNWKSSDGVSGTINATLPGGKTYSGQYFQITKDTTVDSIGPLWAGWGGRGGRAWGYWGVDSSPDFITHYTGRVVANLAEPSGAHMRCQFQLVHPSDGMNGGGLGQCQMPDGTSIDANFPRG
jgi:hypothetical protein